MKPRSRYSAKALEMLAAREVVSTQVLAEFGCKSLASVALRRLASGFSGRFYYLQRERTGPGAQVLCFVPDGAEVPPNTIPCE